MVEEEVSISQSELVARDRRLTEMSKDIWLGLGTAGSGGSGRLLSHRHTEGVIRLDVITWAAGSETDMDKRGS